MVILILIIETQYEYWEFLFITYFHPLSLISLMLTLLKISNIIIWLLLQFLPYLFFHLIRQLILSNLSFFLLAPTSDYRWISISTAFFMLILALSDRLLINFLICLFESNIFLLKTIRTVQLLQIYGNCSFLHLIHATFWCSWHILESMHLFRPTTLFVLTVFLSICPASLESILRVAEIFKLWQK